MKIIETKNGVILKNFENFDLGQTLDCGQCFRFQKIEKNRYKIIAFEKVLIVTQKQGEIIFENIKKKEFENVWKDYFDLNTDYSKIWENLKSVSQFLDNAYKYAPGIRILRQEPWETLCSFIISQNNNIPRIKKIISKLCEGFGEKIENSENDFSFPKAKILAKKTEKDLEFIKSGFRAKYIIDAAKKVSNGEINLEYLSKIPINKALDTLMKIKGVGPKVSSCVLLYGVHRLESFPIDIWIKKVMNTYFKGNSPEIFGKYAGVAQQYLYYYSKENSNILF